MFYKELIKSTGYLEQIAFDLQDATVDLQNNARTCAETGTRLAQLSSRAVRREVRHVRTP
jgi:hypothetical protein